MKVEFLYPDASKESIRDLFGYDYRARTQCAFCGSVILQEDALRVVKHTNGTDIQEDFCGETCANEHYLEMLRRDGL